MCVCVCVCGGGGGPEGGYYGNGGGWGKGESVVLLGDRGLDPVVRQTTIKATILLQFGFPLNEFVACLCRCVAQTDKTTTTTPLWWWPDAAPTKPSRSATVESAKVQYGNCTEAVLMCNCVVVIGVVIKIIVPRHAFVLLWTSLHSGLSVCLRVSECAS